jgi:hypothetical protein
VLQQLDREFGFVPKFLALRSIESSLIRRLGVPMMWMARHKSGARRTLPYDQWVTGDTTNPVPDDASLEPVTREIATYYQNSRHYSTEPCLAVIPRTSAGYVRGWAYEEALALEDYDTIEEEALRARTWYWYDMYHNEQAELAARRYYTIPEYAQIWVG